MRRSGRAAILSVLVVAVAVGACGGTATSPARSSTTTPAATGSTPSTSPDAAVATALWPTAANPTRYPTPESAARGFATGFLSMVDPVVGTFRQGDARSGEVPVRPDATGPETTVLVRQLTAADSWWVLGSATAAISISRPAALETVSSPLTVRGTSTAYEATVDVSLRLDDATAPLAEGTAMGGANGQMGPFETTLAFSAPPGGRGALVVSTTSAKDGTVAEATAIRVRF
jgi:hypothetical protein